KLKNFNLSEQRGWDEKSIATLLDSINSRNTVTLEKFLTSFGIRLVGPNAAKLIANHYKSYENWYEAIAQISYGSEVSDQLMNIIGIGEGIITSSETDHNILRSESKKNNFTLAIFSITVYIKQKTSLQSIFLAIQQNSLRFISCTPIIAFISYISASIFGDLAFLQHCYASAVVICTFCVSSALYT
ncbi:hypothetical protein HET73_06175, partial [Wolbachia endosymbiont of Atemnus politus]|nr:hypothetical protein [Wolbachia endosymbiont of Atemnus politus]